MGVREEFGVGVDGSEREYDDGIDEDEGESERKRGGWDAGAKTWAVRRYATCSASR